jgi:hypothetical protein
LLSNSTLVPPTGWEPAHVCYPPVRLASASGDNTIRIWNTVHRNCEIALTAGVVAVTPGGGKMGYMDILAVIN